jgi:hypothetical protein
MDLRCRSVRSSCCSYPCQKHSDFGVRSGFVIIGALLNQFASTAKLRRSSVYWDGRRHLPFWCSVLVTLCFLELTFQRVVRRFLAWSFLSFYNTAGCQL